MSSRADDFDVRYSGAGSDRPRANGGYGGTVSYDLGYDAQGWDTQGFRRPEAGYGDASFSAGPDPREAGRDAGFGPEAAEMGMGGVGTAVRTSGPPRGRPGSHARGDHGPDPDQAGQQPWQPETPRPRRRRGRAQKTQVKIKGSWWRRWTVRKALGVLLSLIGAFIVLIAAGVVVAYEQTPVPTEAMAATAFSQSVVYSSDGTLIGRFGTMNRQMLSYSDLQASKYLIPAVLAAEDRNFWTEGGISPTGIVRAAYSDVQGGNSLQGGSTITQEFVRHYYEGIGTQQTLSRKIKEIFVAMKVAKEKSKQWILTNYLNTIYMGQGAYGIGAAAETYFNEPVSHLTAAQAAVIAAIIQQPSSYPLPQYRANLEARWHYVLNGMVQMGTLTAQQAAAMKFPKLGDHVARSVGNDVWDPYILDMVYNELVDVYHFNQSQIYNGGYVIRTTINDSMMRGLYQAVSQNEAQINAGSSAYGFKPYMHVGAVLENPSNGEIQALYPGPGYPGSKYNGTGHVITASECKKIACEVNMAVYNREQVGSSFKPYVLATAVKMGMNVKTSTLNGYNPLWIPLDTQQDTFATNNQADAQYQWYKVNNDSMGENGPYTPQMAMAVSINTAYADLWHKVGGSNVAQMAQAFGVNTVAAGITGKGGMEHEAGVALGQGSLTVGEQATMLAAIADNGVYHNAHVISSITRNNVQTPLKLTYYPVFDQGSPTLNAEEASQIQYAMSEDTASYGTAPGAAMSNGQEVIAKTGTTNTAQSAFFIGAIPKESLAVALFTSNQTGAGSQTLNLLGGLQQGGYGGTWPAAIWHTFAENVFVPMGVQTFQTPTFTGGTWNQVPPNLRKAPAKKTTKKKQHPHGQPGGHNNPNGNGNGNGNNQYGPGGGVNPNPNPYPTYSCDPSVVTCNPLGGNGQSVTAVPAAVGGIVAGPPAACLWAWAWHRRLRRRRRGRG